MDDLRWMALVLACGARAEELDGAESAQLSSSASATKALTKNAVSGGDPAPPSCPGRATRHLRIGGTLSPAASWTTWDRLRLVRLELRAQHVAPSSWIVHVPTTDGGPLIERATLRLDETSGILAHIEGDRSIQLPLVDGRPGPPIELDFGTPLDEEGLRPGTLIATETSSQIFFWASGSPASDCAAEAATNP